MRLLESFSLPCCRRKRNGKSRGSRCEDWRAPVEQTPGRGRIYCMLPCCNESDEEIAASVANFRQANMPQQALRSRVDLFIFLDRQSDTGPDTPTFAALRRHLNLAKEPTHRAWGCRVWCGDIDGLPFELYVKGDGCVAGKRHSQIIFAAIAEVPCLLDHFASTPNSNSLHLSLKGTTRVSNGHKHGYDMLRLKRASNCLHE